MLWDRVRKVVLVSVSRSRPIRRVVVTGLGTVSCLGNSAEETWQNMLAGRSGVKLIESFDTKDCPIKVAGEVRNFDAVEILGEKWAGRGFQYVQYALAAALEAIANAGLDVDRDDFVDVGIVISNAHGVGWILRQAGQDIRHEHGLADDYELSRYFWRAVSAMCHPPYEESVFGPRMALLMSSEAATDIVGERIGSLGPRFTISTACVSGVLAINRAWRWLRHGQCDVAIAGGAECVIEPNGIWALNAMRALASHEHDPGGSSRPFDKNRSGFVVSDGAGILVLETLEHAKARGARILAELVGNGGSANAFSLFAPQSDGVGPHGAMKAALSSAGISHRDIDVVYAHATATGVGDPDESAGIKMTFKDHTPRISITAPKSMMGHAIGAAGALGAVECVQSIRDQVVPPTINLTDPDECAEGLHIVRDEPEERRIDYVLNNAFGFGGSNGSNIFKRFVE